MWPDVKLDKKEAIQRIAFYGPMASGKTWCANHLVNNYGYKKVSFADKLKAICYELYGIQGKEERHVLQGVGQDLRKYDQNVWIKYALQRIKEVESDTKGILGWNGIVIDDLRYLNEAKVLKRNGFLLIQVIVDDTTRAQRINTLYPNTTEESHAHASEQEWSLIVPDYIVESYDYEAALDLSEIFGKEKLKSVRYPNQTSFRR